MENNKYTIVNEFVCCGKEMVVVKLEHGTHVMSRDEWRWTFGQSKSERWENGKRVVKNKKIA